MALCIAMAIALAALLLAGAAGSPLHPAVPAGLAVLLMIGLAAVEVLAWKRLRQLRDRAVELRNSQLHLAALLDSIPEGLFMTDLDGRITAINKASARAMNQTPASATGKMIADLTDAETGRRLTETRLKVIASQKMVRDEARYVQDGKARWYDIIYVPVRDNKTHALTNVSGIARDTTARRDAENLAREASAKLERSVQELERVNASIQLLAHMMDALQACSTVEESFDVFRKYCGRLLPGMSGALYLLRSSRDLLEPVAHFGGRSKEGTGEAELLPPEDCLGMRRGRAHAVTDPDTDLVCSHWHAVHQSTGAAPTLCLPLAAQGDMIGLLAFRSAAGQPIEETLAQHARSMAEQIALSLSSLKLREQLRRQSIVDSLTGLYNRRFLDESILRELARASRKAQPLSLLMLDLDHFKKWNDTRGHDAGDQVLRLVGSELQRAVRGSDLACRFGGEEFAILMPETDPDIALERANTIRERIGRIDIEYGGQVAGRISVSIGVASFPLHASDANSLVRAADAALYEAKGAGRDRVMLPEDAVSSRSGEGRASA